MPLLMGTSVNVHLWVSEQIATALLTLYFGGFQSTYAVIISFRLAYELALVWYLCILLVSSACYIMACFLCQCSRLVESCEWRGNFEVIQTRFKREKRREMLMLGSPTVLSPSPCSPSNLILISRGCLAEPGVS